MHRSVVGTMDRLTVLLLCVSVSIVSSTFSTSPPIPGFWGSTTLVDSENCVRLRCQWRGDAEHCRHIAHYNPHRYSLCFNYTNKNDTDVEFLYRLKRQFQLNSFEIDDIYLGEGCNQDQLCCNVDRIDIYGEYELNCEAQPEYHDYHPKKQQQKLMKHQKYWWW